jgi:hypothetical protein
MRIAFLLTVLGVVFAGCSGSVCTPKSVRCYGVLVQKCDERGVWKSITDCGRLKPRDMNWKCCCNGTGGCACKPGEKRPQKPGDEQDE